MTVSETEIIAVVAGLIFKDGRLLACQRRAGGAFALKWEFPGGKIESGEDPGAALARELREELEISVDGIEKIFEHTHVYAGFACVDLKFFYVPVYCGEMVNRVFERVRWVGAEELTQLDFLDGDRPVIEWLLHGEGSALWRPREF
jgi:8-oxo-dGTP diphosphatase